jgi:AcrR family transcriptional regulator
MPPESSTATGPRATARRTGRRPGNPDTRETILQTAQKAFAANGFTGATIRGIAAEAGVDPALVHHYFGTKENLLLATVQVPVNPREVVDTVTSGPVETLGTRLAGMVLSVWASPAGTALAAALRSAIDDPAIARTIREFLLSQVIRRVLRHVGCPAQELDIRAALLASQMIGVIMGRHILKLEPLASQPIQALVPQVGATLQRYLTGPLVPHRAD